MSSISTALPLSQISAAVGYAVKQTNKGALAGFLPHKAVIWCEISSDKTSAPDEIDATLASEVGEEYGYDSPAYAMARILRPLSGNPLGGIPTIFKKLPITGTTTVITYEATVANTLTSDAVIIIPRINGRTSIDGNNYQMIVPKGSTAVEVNQILVDAVNNVLACPLNGVLTDDKAVLTTGWSGLTSADVIVEFEFGKKTGGITIAETARVDGVGTPSLSGVGQSLIDSEEWITDLINGLGTDLSTLSYLEDVNGNITEGTGKYSGNIWQPFHAYSGTRLSTKEAAELITDPSIEEMTNVICPAPNSEMMPFEIATAWARVFIPNAESIPHKDPMLQFLPDIEVPADKIIGDFSDPAKRDQIVSIGMSTVKLTSGKYQILDFVTTRHPASQSQTSMDYRWVKDQNLRFNVKFSDKFLAQVYVVGRTIVDDGSEVSAVDTISPIVWIGILETKHFPFLIDNAIIASYEDVKCQIGETNANRLETSYGVKLTGTARVLSTTIETSYNYGG